MRKSVASLLILSSLFFSLPEAKTEPTETFQIVETIMCAEFDKETRKPTSVMSEFPKGTKILHCWFTWKNAPPGLKFTARWHFVSGNMRILDLPVTLTRHTDHGIISLEMPQGKTFPSGSYRLDFELDGRVIQTRSFTML